MTDVCRLIGKRFVPLQVGYIIDLDRLLKYTQHTYTYLHLFSLTHINNLRRSNIPLRPLFLILFYHSSDFLFNVLIFMHRLSVILLKYWWIRPCFCNVFSLGGGGWDFCLYLSSESGGAFTQNCYKPSQGPTRRTISVNTFKKFFGCDGTNSILHFNVCFH